MKKTITSILAVILIAYGVFGNGLLDLLDNKPQPAPEPQISILNIDRPSSEILERVKIFGELIKDPTDRAKIAIFNYEFANRLVSYTTNLQQLNDVYVLAGQQFFKTDLVGKYKDLPDMIIKLIEEVTGEQNHVLSEEEKAELHQKFLGVAWVLIQKA
jgi:hypothetical protein